MRDGWIQLIYWFLLKEFQRKGIHEKHLDFLNCYKTSKCTNNHSHTPKSRTFLQLSVSSETISNTHIHTTAPKPACLQLSVWNAIFRQAFVLRVTFVSGHHSAWKKREGGQETKYDRTNGELLGAVKGHRGPMNTSVPRKRSSLTWSLNSHFSSLGIFTFNLYVLPTRVVFHKKREKIQTVCGQRHWSEHILVSGTNVLGRMHEPLH